MMIMDALTLAINSINNEWITSISLIINNKIIYGIILIGIILFLEKKRDKRIKLFTSLILVSIVGVVLKEIFAIPRPCGELALKAVCDGYSLPSIHAATAFTLALGFLDDKKYVLILIFAILVSLSRLYLGVHTFFDIGASIAITPIVYGFVDHYWKGSRLNKNHG